MLPILTIITIILPGIAAAEETGCGDNGTEACKTIERIITDLTEILKLLLPVLFAIPVVVFLWGIIKFIYAAGSGDEEKIKQGKKFIVYGLIGLAIMVALWGFVELIINLFFPGGNYPTTMPMPQINI
jgi:hypothetical protein